MQLEHIKELEQIMQNESLISLSDNDFNYKSINVLTLRPSDISKCNSSFSKFHPMKNICDLINCNNDLKTFTAYLFYYKPFINNPTEESYFSEGEYHAPYFQNAADYYYSTFVSSCYEKLYNFWDRIGDALAYYFNVDIKENEVNFGNVIDRLHKRKDVFENEYFRKLLDFRSLEFAEFNSKRRDIVHYYQYQTEFFFEHSANISDKGKIESMWTLKNQMAQYFSQHLRSSCEGYYNTYRLINMLS